MWPQEERERGLEFRGLLRTEEKVIVTLHPRIMALRKILKGLSENSCERGLISDRPPIPFAITDSGIEDLEKHEITLRVDPKIKGNTFKKKVHVYGGDTRGCYDLAR